MPEAASLPRVNPFAPHSMIRDPRLFFGRVAELAAIRDYLRRDTNVSIVAARRMGKSSLLWFVKENGPREIGGDRAFHYLDLELVADADDFTGRLIELLGAKGETTRDLERALAGRRLVLCLDEFDRTAHNPDFPPLFFASLRSLAQWPNLTLVTATKTPLIDFSASGGMSSPFYNIFPTPIALGPLADDEAGELLARTAATAGIEFDAASLARAVELAQGFPAHLQLIGSLMVESGQNWKEAERKFREALARGNGMPGVPARGRGGRAALPDWLEPLASLLILLSVVVGVASVGTRFVFGIYVALALGVAYFVLLGVERVALRRR